MRTAGRPLRTVPLTHRRIAPGVEFYDLHPSPGDLRAEVLTGLSQPQKRLPPKLFYDLEGSRLFDAITALPEYYPTRTEIAILHGEGERIARRMGKGLALVELGSGSSLKIRLLLEALEPALYVPVDISREHLLSSARALSRRFPGLPIRAVCTDYSVPFAIPLGPEWSRRAAFFPGSSIGNFEPVEAVTLLARIARLLGPGGRLLIGVDPIKDPAVLHAAYNDTAGITAAFNLNVLARINRELGADFDLSAFTHRAFYNPLTEAGDELGRIEMHLESLQDQQATIAGRTFGFRAGETVHTESSYKYSPEGFRGLAAQAGFLPEDQWTDPDGLFSVHCLLVDRATAAD